MSEEITRAQLTEAEKARGFILAGRAVLTLVSKRTGARFTYRVQLAKDSDEPFFVSVLTGPTNTTDYEYLGIIRGGQFRTTRATRISADAPCAKAFAWSWARLARGELPAELEIWHEGRCGHCGRVLTVPESIADGIGPVCREKAAA